MNPRPSPSPKLGKMPIKVAALAFDLCVLYYHTPCTLYSSLTTKNTRTKGDCKSNSITPHPN